VAILDNNDTGGSRDTGSYSNDNGHDSVGSDGGGRGADNHDSTFKAIAAGHCFPLVVSSQIKNPYPAQKSKPQLSLSAFGSRKNEIRASSNFSNRKIVLSLPTSNLSLPSPKRGARSRPALTTSDYRRRMGGRGLDLAPRRKLSGTRGLRRPAAVATCRYG
jgi:hypothetical protein